MKPQQKLAWVQVRYCMDKRGEIKGKINWNKILTEHNLNQEGK